jgi:hypothetical protein
MAQGGLVVGAKKQRITGLFTLRRSSGSAYATARSFRYAPFPRRCSGTFCPPCKCYAVAYSGGQNVVNSRNVMRHFFEKRCKKLYKNK